MTKGSDVDPDGRGAERSTDMVAVDDSDLRKILPLAAFVSGGIVETALTEPVASEALALARLAIPAADAARGTFAMISMLNSPTCLKAPLSLVDEAAGGDEGTREHCSF